jgi:hypothetical protein
MANVEPPAAREYIICADNDRNGTGLRNARALADRLAMPGVTVRIAMPPWDWDDGPRQSWDFNDVLRFEQSPDRQRQAAGEILSSPLVTGRFGVGPLTMSEIRVMEAPPLAYMLKPWLHVGALAMLHAPTGHGKTHVAMAAGYAVASGREVMGWQAGAARRVLYVDGELPLELLKARVEALGPDCDNFMVLSRDILRARNVNMPMLGDEAGQQWLDHIIEEHRAECIILDSLSTVFGKSVIENEAECWGPVQELMMAHRFRRRSILLIHHEGRGTNAQRGTTKREDVMDSILRVKECPDKCTDTVSAFESSYPKHRRFYGADAKAKLLRLDISSGTVVWTHEPLEDNQERVAKLLRDGYSQKEIVRMLGLSKGQVSKLAQRIAAQDAERRRANGNGNGTLFDGYGE